MPGVNNPLTPAEVQAFVQQYRNQAPPGEVNSVWLSAAGILQFLKNYPSAAENITGLRVYFARYAQGVGDTGQPGFPANGLTVIVVPTIEQNGSQADIQSAYYNYGNRCPAECNGGM